MADLQSRPYQPDESQCCEACVFGRGEHAEWCFLPLAGGIPSDCDYCQSAVSTDFDAIGMLAGRAICRNCLPLSSREGAR